MAPLAPGDIEQALLPYRIGRRVVSSVISEYIVSCEDLTDPFLLLSRLFIRLKSADSILEKIHRKNLAVSTVSDIGQVMDDLLGFRIITGNLEDLWAFDRFLQASFDVRSRIDTINSADQFGYRSSSIYWPVVAAMWKFHLRSSCERNFRTIGQVALQPFFTKLLPPKPSNM